MSTGTFFNTTLATSTGTVAPPAFLPFPFPLPLPPSPTSVGAEEQADSRRAATRTPSSFEGCKQVDLTTVFSILPALRPRIGNTAGALIYKRRCQVGTGYRNVDKEDKWDSDLPFWNTTIVWCLASPNRAATDCEILNQILVLVTPQKFDYCDRWTRRVRQKHGRAFGCPASGIHLHRLR